MAAEQHDIRISGRKVVEVTGVSSVESFDVHAFLLTTSAGPLHIQGSNLHMKQLDLEAGRVYIEGTVSRLEYVSDKGKKQSMMGKLLR